jgi:hypothetical protein
MCIGTKGAQMVLFMCQVWQGINNASGHASCFHQSPHVMHEISIGHLDRMNYIQGPLYLLIALSDPQADDTNTTHHPVYAMLFFW